MPVTPIFVGGNGRSGTTVMAAALSKNRSTLRLNETSMFCDPDTIAPFYSQVTRAWTPFTVDLALRRLREAMVYRVRDYTTLVEEGCAERLLDTFIEDVTAYQSYAKYVGAELPIRETREREIREELAGHVRTWIDRLIFKIEQENCQRSRRPVHLTHFVDDTCWNSCVFNTLAEIWPDSLRVHMVRHPLDTLCSVRKRTENRDPDTNWWWPQDLIQIAERIASMMLQPVDGYVVRLEDLIESPEDVLRPLYKHAGMKWHSHAPQAVRDPETAHVHRHVKELSRRDRKRVKRILQPVCDILGYDC